jgi:monoamine oxidase
MSDTEVVIIGGGAAGVAAGRRLQEANVRCLIVEARPRLGGRAWTVHDADGFTLDLGCGWLHSADRNPWVAVAESQGRIIDKTPPPWRRPSLPNGFPLADQQAFFEALGKFFARVDAATEGPADVAAVTLLEPGSRWNNMINAINTYISGVELDRLSVQDFSRYEDSGVNWRVVEGYGTMIAAHGASVPATLDCPVKRIDHRGPRLRIDTAKGSITADQAIVSLPTTVLAQEESLFDPVLAEKVDAAAGLPLGLDDKLFIALENADEFEKDSRVFGRTDSTATAGYHMRPFGRPMIEAYFGGTLAAELEAQGERAFFHFAVAELVGLFGSAFARRLKPLRTHGWGRDPFARGSYSSALPGKADCRQTLAAPVDERLFFAGEACSPHDFSTAHGAWSSGVTAAEQVIAVRTRRSARKDLAPSGKET